MKKHLSLEQRVHNARGGQEAEQLHALHSYLHAMTHSAEEWGEIWSKGNPDKTKFDTASWAHSFGRMRGFDEVWFNSVTGYNIRGIKPYFSSYEAFPEITHFGDFRSLSECSMHAIGTEVIEVADDGKSARAFFLTPGVLYAAINDMMHYVGTYLWERYGADYVYENGRWLYLHEQVCPDLGGQVDNANGGLIAYERMTSDKKPMGPPPKPKGPDIRQPQVRVTDPGPLHNNWTPIQTVQNTVPWPVPYKTLDEENSYTQSIPEA